MNKKKVGKRYEIITGFIEEVAKIKSDLELQTLYAQERLAILQQAEENLLNFANEINDFINIENDLKTEDCQTAFHIILELARSFAIDQQREIEAFQLAKNAIEEDSKSKLEVVGNV